jgi:DNA polymerase-3 subunit beta
LINKETFVKIKIKRESFLEVFQIAALVAPARSPKAILQNVKISVDKEGGILTATDTEVGVKLRIPDLEVSVPGAAVIPVTRLSMILRESRDEFLSMETSGEITKIKGQHSNFELQSHDPEQFPEVEEFSEADYYEISPNLFKNLIRRTLFATDTESSRYALGGVLLEITDNRIVAVGTDGRRLAKMEGEITKVGNPKGDAGTTIVPSRSMQLIERMLPEGEVPIQIAFRSNELLVRDSTGVFHTRLVEGRFPKWRDVIPKRVGAHQIEILVGPLYSALRQAAIVSSEDSRGIDFGFSEGTLVLTNSTAEIGSTRVEIPVPYVEESMTISLDNRFVADFLKVLPPEMTFTMDIQQADEAAYCFTEDDYGYVIMPMSRDKR